MIHARLLKHEEETDSRIPVVSALSAPFDRMAEERTRHRAQYERHEYMTHWMGVELLQYPEDLMIYQLLIEGEKPDYVIEAGTFWGGLALYLAMVLEQANPNGKVLTIDIDGTGWRQTAQLDVAKRLADRITFYEASSTDPELHKKFAEMVAGKKVLVILDSLHTRDHVLKEIELFSKYIPVGGSLIVNDTHLDNTHWLSGGLGPRTAVKDFIKTHDDWVIAERPVDYNITCFPDGLLRRIK